MHLGIAKINFAMRKVFTTFALYSKSNTMERIVITPKTEQEYSFVMEMLKRMKIKATPVSEAPMRRMTVEEYRDMANEAIIAVREGRVVSQEELKREMAQW